MLFNIAFNFAPRDLNKARDLVRLLHHGLVENGHQVYDFGVELMRAPAVNLLIGRFAAERVDALLALKAEHGADLRLGIVSAIDLADDDPAVTPARVAELADLRRVLPVADFIWVLTPQVAAYGAVVGPGKVAQLTPGFSERLVVRPPLEHAELRNIDVAMIGEETPYRASVIDALRAAGLNCVTCGSTPMPGFIVDDVVRRAKLLVDLRRHSQSRCGSLLRMAAGLHAGTLVVSEAGGLDSGANYAVTPAPGQFVQTCAAAIHSGMAVQLGLGALAKFRAETSWRANMAAALQLPVLQNFARGG